MDGVVSEIAEPRMFISAPGVRKVALVIEDVEFSNIHPNPDDCRDIAKLENRFTVNAPTIQNREQVIL